MKRFGRTDGNQSRIVTDLRKAGATVQPLSSVGNGCPDLLVGFRDANYVIEIKDPAEDPNKRRLTKAEQRWHDAWRGQRAVVETVTEALTVIGAVPRMESAL